MPSPVTLLFSAVIVATCCLAMGHSQAPNAGPGSSMGQGSAKKLRVLNPVAANRVYRILRYGGAANSGDDDEILFEDDNIMQKRQYDDYGHMRFGKRQSGGKGDFDDYGHLRFGK